jgi:hypothetical protein
MTLIEADPLADPRFCQQGQDIVAEIGEFLNIIEE